jgi:hypothetical protein
MNSFKKLSIAIAAALAIGTTVAVTPASAATTLTVNSVAAVGGTTSAAPVSLTVPDTNNVLSANALNIEVDSLAANTTVTAVATNGRILTTIGTLVAPVAASAGSTTVSFNTGSGSTASFYVFTTNTSAGTVSVTVNGNTSTYHFKGTAGAINTIGLSNPESAAAGSVQKITLSAADIFGNAKGGASISLQVVNSAGTTTTPYTTESATTATAVIGTKVVDIAMPASGIVTLIATASTASAVTGFATPIGVVVKTITVRDLASELAIIQAQLAAERTAHQATKDASAKALADAKIASDLVLATAIADHKKKFNALAKKWNAKNPRAKVALIK